jgi:hypothetical protein
MLPYLGEDGPANYNCGRTGELDCSVEIQFLRTSMFHLYY